MSVYWLEDTRDPSNPTAPKAALQQLAVAGNIAMKQRNHRYQASCYSAHGSANKHHQKALLCIPHRHRLARTAQLPRKRQKLLLRNGPARKAKPHASKATSSPGTEGFLSRPALETSGDAIAFSVSLTAPTSVLGLIPMAF